MYRSIIFSARAPCLQYLNIGKNIWVYSTLTHQAGGQVFLQFLTSPLTPWLGWIAYVWLLLPATFVRHFPPAKIWQVFKLSSFPSHYLTFSLTLNAFNSRQSLNINVHYFNVGYTKGFIVIYQDSRLFYVTFEPTVLCSIFIDQGTGWRCRLSSSLLITFFWTWLYSGKSNLAQAKLSSKFEAPKRCTWFGKDYVNICTYCRGNYNKREALLHPPPHPLKKINPSLRIGQFQFKKLIYIYWEHCCYDLYLTT